MEKWVDMKKLLALSSFFLIIPVGIFTSIIILSLVSLNHTKSQTLGVHSKGVAYAALPESDNLMEATIVEEESKEEILRQFFAKYNSPLEPYAGKFIESAEENGLDYRLLPAIAMQESNLCRRVIPDSHNCWGWGIYGSKVTKFSSYEEAIDTVSRGLANKYRDKHGLITPKEVGQMYNPRNTNNWAENVSYFMNQLM